MKETTREKVEGEKIQIAVSQNKEARQKPFSPEYQNKTREKNMSGLAVAAANIPMACLVDSYKASHFKLYPSGCQEMQAVSWIECF